MLDAGDFITRRAIVLGNFGLDDDLRVELARYDEIRRLIEAGDLLRSFRFDVRNSRFAQHILD
jgi:hypothetical protein